jgi:tRNA-splicing ligase RtcB
MSRKQAHDSFEWEKVNRLLRDRGVHLISAGIDEVPGVYKDIEQVMASQRDLVEILGRFEPRIVKMAPTGERAED